MCLVHGDCGAALLLMPERRDAKEIGKKEKGWEGGEAGKLLVQVLQMKCLPLSTHLSASSSPLSFYTSLGYILHHPLLQDSLYFFINLRFVPLVSMPSAGVVLRGR